jgi:Chromo (CHRromatin Organisation MOdifier) domain
MSSFKALYGYEPPNISLGSVPGSHVEAVDEVLRERHALIQQLKIQLHQAQNRMKVYADRKRSERHFSVGAWVYLKLQPYRQVSVQRKHNKLSANYYRPFELIERIGKMAYRLNLPEDSQVHPVFHVSQLKERISAGAVVSPRLPNQVRLKSEPVAVLDRRIIKRGNNPVAQFLIRWSHLPDSDATWENYLVIKQQFPEFRIEGNSNVEREGVSAMLMQVKGIEEVHGFRKKDQESF